MADRTRCPVCYGRVVAHCEDRRCRWWKCSRAERCHTWGDEKDRFATTVDEPAQ